MNIYLTFTKQCDTISLEFDVLYIRLYKCHWIIITGRTIKVYHQSNALLDIDSEFPMYDILYNQGAIDTNGETNRVMLYFYNRDNRSLEKLEDKLSTSNHAFTPF